jgi:AraC family transcriptional regulator, regulatory protein of adaptative response / methylated-DNA-[protein]-cysteine methyltransferase
MAPWVRLDGVSGNSVWGPSRGVPTRDFDRIARAVEYVVGHAHQQPDLERIARHAGLSPFHFQRLFSRWVGISPKRFLQYVTLSHAKDRLAAARSVLDAAFEAGLSGPSRLHDLFLTWEAVTPGQYKSRGEGLRIAYGFHDTPFGECLLMTTDRGICGLAFVVDGDRDGAMGYLAKGWQRARCEEDRNATGKLVRAVFAMSADGVFEPPVASLKLLLRGTRFQLKVWEALLAVPEGQLASYGDLARRLGFAPGSARALGQAVAGNLIGYLIPCHRVIQCSGLIGGYRWGAARKSAMLAWEALRADAPEESER